MPAGIQRWREHGHIYMHHVIHILLINKFRRQHWESFSNLFQELYPQKFWHFFKLRYEIWRKIKESLNCKFFTAYAISSKVWIFIHLKWEWWHTFICINRVFFLMGQKKKGRGRFYYSSESDHKMTCSKTMIAFAIIWKSILGDFFIIKGCGSYLVIMLHISYIEHCLD